MIDCDRRDGVRVLRMRFGSANALGPVVCEQILEALDAERCPTVLTGEGRVFSAGLNLIELDGLDRAELAAFLERFSVLMVRALTARYPLVAAVNGHAVAGGCVLAMACDRRVGTRGPYKVGMNEMAIGLTLPAVVTEILRGKLCAEHAHTVVLGGALYEPEQACQVGLLDELADDAEAAVDRACALAAELARGEAEFATMKGTLVAPIVERFRQTREALDHCFVESWFREPAITLRREAIERLRGAGS